MWTEERKKNKNQHKITHRYYSDDIVWRRLAASKWHRWEPFTRRGCQPSCQHSPFSERKKRKEGWKEGRRSHKQNRTIRLAGVLLSQKGGRKQPVLVASDLRRTCPFALTFDLPTPVRGRGFNSGLKRNQESVAAHAEMDPLQQNNTSSFILKLQS